MRKFLGVAASALFLLVGQARAQMQPQESPVAVQAKGGSWEYGLLFQGGKGLTEDRDAFQFFMAGAHLGKVLTPEIGKGFFKGNV